MWCRHVRSGGESGRSKLINDLDLDPENSSADTNWGPLDGGQTILNRAKPAKPLT